MSWKVFTVLTRCLNDVRKILGGRGWVGGCGLQDFSAQLLVQIALDHFIDRDMTWTLTWTRA